LHLLSDACAHSYGILNKERGLPCVAPTPNHLNQFCVLNPRLPCSYCNFVPLNIGATKTTGFVAAINDVWTDELGRCVT